MTVLGLDRHDDDSTVVGVHAAAAQRVDFVTLTAGDAGAWNEAHTSLGRPIHGLWTGRVGGLQPGDRYGLRVDGPWDPRAGHRHNAAKLLLDPYARAVILPERLHPEVFGHTVDGSLAGDPSVRDDRDSAAFAPHGIVTGPSGFDWGGDARPGTPWRDTIVYEAHVSGLSKRHPAIPPELRGTYAGLAHPAVVEHLVGLGVTAVELLPIHAFLPDRRLAALGRPNYWGYSTLSFFAPHPAYASTTDPLGVLDEFKAMVKALHAAGLEVILDVVYNHTCEADITGPTLSWRGLDAATYYRLDAAGRDVDTTGCGNSLDARSFPVVRMILDSLRYWISEMHVDGFRFDLATTLARGRNGFDPEHPLLVAMRADPLINQVKLIAEPWDVGPGGWQTGGFPPPFAEWNDRYRDDVRDFWLTGARRIAHGEPATSGVSRLATRLAGSADLFNGARGPNASVNFVTAHDGFTLADLTAYDVKHNEANGEEGRDGTDDNRSWNHGVEGPTDDGAITEARLRSARNLMATLLLSAGVPMLTAGDELGRSQHGNNNPYCLDDETSWVDWSPTPVAGELTAAVRFLSRLRLDHPALGRDRFFDGRPADDHGIKDLAWFSADGTEMTDAGWSDPSTRTLQMYLHDDRDTLLIVFCGAAGAQEVTLPGGPWATHYRVLWSTSGARATPTETESHPAGGTVVLPAPTVSILLVDTAG